MSEGRGIRVVCRVRPQNKSELERDGTTCIEFPSPVNIKVKEHTFTFDRVFDGSATQKMVYEEVAKPSVADLLGGYNATIFVYGQTSSGKTFTMQGPSINDPINKGVTPRIMDDIFQEVANASDDSEFTLKCSYLEIYMEKIRDLLDGRKQNLKVREDKIKGIYVEGATEVNVGTPAEVNEVLTVGQHNRAIAETSMNQQSSRSHSCFVLYITHKSGRDQSTRAARLYLVDLAGSEKVGKTGASGTTLDEAKMINKSLSALGLVINALTEGKTAHIPYRDSKLTRILQESLGGNSRTTLCINCSPSTYNLEETLSTLRFGSRAKTIKNKAHANVERSAAELKAMLAKAEAEIAKLQECIGSLQEELSVVRKNPGAAPPSSPAPGSSSPSPAAANVDVSKLPNVIKMKEHIEQLESKLAASEEEKLSLLEAQEGLRDQLAEKTTQNGALQAEAQELSGKLDEAAMDLQGARSQLEQTNILAKMLEKENEGLKRDIDEQQEQIARLSHERHQFVPLVSPPPVSVSRNESVLYDNHGRPTPSFGGTETPREFDEQFDFSQESEAIRTAVQQGIDRIKLLSLRLEKQDLKDEMQAEVQALETTLMTPRGDRSPRPGSCSPWPGDRSPRPLRSPRPEMTDDDQEVKRLSDMTEQAMKLLTSMQEAKQRQQTPEPNHSPAIPLVSPGFTPIKSAPPQDAGQHEGSILERASLFLVEDMEQEASTEVVPTALCLDRTIEAEEQKAAAVAAVTVVDGEEEENEEKLAEEKVVAPVTNSDAKVSSAKPAVAGIEPEEKPSDATEQKTLAAVDEQKRTEEATVPGEEQPSTVPGAQAAATEEKQSGAEGEDNLLEGTKELATEPQESEVVSPSAQPEAENKQAVAEPAVEQQAASAEPAKPEEGEAVPAGAAESVPAGDAAASEAKAEPEPSPEPETDEVDDVSIGEAETESEAVSASTSPSAPANKFAEMAEAAAEAMRKQQEQYETKVADLNTELEAARGEKQSLESRVSQAEAEVAQLKEKLASQAESAATSSLREELNSLKKATESRLEDFEKLRKALVADLENRCLKVIELEVQLDEMTEKYEVVRQEKPRANERALKRQILTLVRDFQKSVIEIRKLSSENKRLQLQAETIMMQQAVKDKRIQELESQMRDMQRRGSISRSAAPQVPVGKQMTMQLAQTARVSKPLRGGGGKATFLLHSASELANVPSASDMDDSATPSPKPDESVDSTVHDNEEISWQELLSAK